MGGINWLTRANGALLAATIALLASAVATHADPSLPVTPEEKQMIAELHAAGIGLSSSDWQIADAAVGVCNALDHYTTAAHAGDVIVKDLGPGLTRSQIDTFDVIAAKYECPEDMTR